MTNPAKRTTPIILMRGISGSGKSTYAREHYSDYRIVCRDELRSRYCDLNEYFDGGMRTPFEDYLTTVEEYEITQAICKGIPLVIDNTNLRRKYIQNYINIFAELNVDPSAVKIVELDTTSGVAMNRNLAANKHVSKDVINQQYRQFLSDKIKIEDFVKHGEWVTTSSKRSHFSIPIEVEPYMPNEDLPPAVIIDLDGTSATRAVGPNMRSFYDYSNIESDNAVEFVSLIIHALMSFEVEPIFLSGRPEELAREGTEKFIREKIGVSDFELYMRSDAVDTDENGDRKPDYMVKYRLFNENLRERYNVVGAFDDRRQIVNLWEELGIKCLICSNSNEFGSY